MSDSGVTEKLKENCSGKSGWLGKAEYRIKNEWWIKYRDIIYLKYLRFKRKINE